MPQRIFISLLIFASCLFSSPLLAQKTLHIPLQYDTISLDPAFLSDADSIWIATQLYDGLFEFTPTSDVASQLLASWKVSTDNKTYAFTLRKQIRFSDGEPLTARDVRFTLLRLKKLATREQRFLRLLRSIDCTTPHEMVLYFDEPIPNLPRILTSPLYFMLPAHHAAKIRDGSFFRAPIGTGPYTLQHWRKNQEILLTRNPFSQTMQGSPDAVHFVFSDPKKPWTDNALYSFDLLTAFPAYNLKVPPNFSSYWYHRPTMELIIFNVQHPFWRTALHRQAFAALFDKKRYYDIVFKHRRKSWHLSQSLIPAGLPAVEHPPTEAENISEEPVRQVQNYLQKEVTQVFFASHDHLSVRLLEEALFQSFGKRIAWKPQARLISPQAALQKVKRNELGFYIIKIAAESFEPFDILIHFSSDAQANLANSHDVAFASELNSIRIESDLHEQARRYADLSRQLTKEAIAIPIATMFNERLLLRSPCRTESFGPLGPWSLKMDRIRCD